MTMAFMHSTGHTLGIAFQAAYELSLFSQRLCEIVMIFFPYCGEMQSTDNSTAGKQSDQGSKPGSLASLTSLSH